MNIVATKGNILWVLIAGQSCERRRGAGENRMFQRVFGEHSSVKKFPWGDRNHGGGGRGNFTEKVYADGKKFQKGQLKQKSTESKQRKGSRLDSRTGEFRSGSKKKPKKG